MHSVGDVPWKDGFGKNSAHLNFFVEQELRHGFEQGGLLDF